MAPRVEDILVRLKLEGLEGLDRIRSSFRELGKVTQMSEKDILTARTRLLEFASTAGNTEAVISGLIPALKGLRSQVDICGAAYAELSNDIAQVNNVSRGYTDQATAQRNALNAQYGAITNNTEALRRQRAALLDLQQTTRTGSQLYTQLGADIQRTTARLDEMDAVVRRSNAITERGLPSSAAKIRRDLADVRERIRLERAAIDDLNLLTEKQRKDFDQGDLAGESGVRRAIAARQAALNTQLVSERMLSFSENVRNQREAIRTANAMYSTPKFISGERSPERIGAYLGNLPNTVAGLNQQLSELRDRLNNTTLGTRTYVDAALLMAATQRQLREATLGVAAGLVEQLRAGNITPSMANLREVLASVRGEQSLLNTNTAEGARAFQLAEMRARALERQLAALQTTQASLSRTPVSGFGAWSTGVGDRARADRNAFLNLEAQRRASPTGSLTRAQEAQLSSGGFSAADYAAIPEQAARIRRRLEQAQSQSLQRTGSLRPEQQQLVDAANAANAEYAAAYRRHQRVLTDIQQRALEERRAAQLDDNDRRLKQQRVADAAWEADFNRRLNETAVLQQQRAMQRQLGFLGGQNLSSTYQQIVGLSSASTLVNQERMGRSATQVFNDIAAAFREGGNVYTGTPGTNLAENIVDQIDNARPDVARSAANIGQTFIDSIRAKAVESAKAAAKLATSATQAIKDVFGIASPSKFMIDLVNNLVTTYITSLERSYPRIRAATQKAFGELTVERPIRDIRASLRGYEYYERPSTAYRPLPVRSFDPSAMGGEFDEMMRRFRNQIAALTSQPEIYRNLLNALPSSAITTTIAGAANQRAALGEGFLGLQRQVMPGLAADTLERLIAEQAAIYFRSVRTPNPWVGIIGDYKNFIASVANTTTQLRSQALLPESRVRGLLASSAESLAPARALVDDRIAAAYARSADRSATVFAEDAARARLRQPLLPQGIGVAAGGGGGGGGGGGDDPSGPNNSWRRFNETLAQFGPMSAASIDRLGQLRERLESLRTSLGPTEAGYRQVNRAIEQQTQVIDRELARRDRSQRPRLSGMQLAQGFGAALTGGIFGGPEGLIGGLGGLAVGGVGGAFAGAAFGAQAGMFRQQLAGLTDYSARIDKMQIALRGVVKDQASYNAVLDAQAAITRDLNIPQENAMRGLTRLSAAVLGAGGTVTDSTFAYRAMTEAIKATGGSAEQVDGALLALTQVFSKGKVSAEELNQIAERLPGSFTLFAKAAGKTGPELSKALKDGEVGLNDLMKFLQLLNTEYGKGALAVASSTQEAGARLTVAMQGLQRDVGRALQPVGAAFQTAFTAFITDIGPSLVYTLKGLTPAMLQLVSMGPQLAELAKHLLSLGAVVGLTAVFLKFGAAIQFVTALVAAYGSVSVLTKVAVDGLTASLLVNPWTAAAAGVAALVVVLGKAVLEQKALTDETQRYIDTASKQRASEIATTISKLEDQLRAARKAAQAYGSANRSATTFTEPLVQGLIDLVSGATTARNKVEELETRLRKLQGVYRVRIELESIFLGQRGVPEGYKIVDGRLAYMVPGVGYVDARTSERITPSGRTGRTDFSQPSGADDGGGRGRANQEAERAQREAQQAAEELAKQRIRLADLVHQHELDLINKRYQLESDLINKQREIWAQSQTGAARSTASAVNQFIRELETLQSGIRDAETAVSRATKGLQSAQSLAQYQSAAYAAATGPGVAGVMGAYIQGGIGPSGPNTYRPHFDIKRADLGFFERTALDPYVLVNGMPISSSPRQRGQGFYDWRSSRNDYHRGEDYAFEDGARLTLTGGARWLGSSPSDYGDAAAFMTPDGKVYKVIHGRFQPAAGTTATTTVQTTTGAELNRGQGDVAAAQQELAQAKALRDQLIKQFGPQVNAAMQLATLTLTDELRTQNAALEDNVSLNALRNKLQLAGTDQVIIDAELRKAEAAQKTTQQIDLLNILYADAKTRLDALAKTAKPGDPALAAAQGQVDYYAGAIASLNTELERFIWLTDDATLAQLAFGKALSDKETKEGRAVGAGIIDGVDAAIASLGTLRSAVSDFTSTSLSGLGDALVNLATKGAADFRSFAISMLNDLSQLIIKQFVFKTLLDWIRSLGGGGGFGVPSLRNIPDYSAGFTGAPIPFTPNAMGNAYAANGIVPFAYGGVVDQPMLFPFAKGGTMQTGVLGEAGPEAIIPLKRGRDGRLGVSGGGNVTNVNVTVDASNTSAAGNNAQGQALGRAISRAVQSELVNQQRPGGLLDPNRSR